MMSEILEWEVGRGEKNKFGYILEQLLMLGVQ